MPANQQAEFGAGASESVQDGNHRERREQTSGGPVGEPVYTKNPTGPQPLKQLPQGR